MNVLGFKVWYADDSVEKATRWPERRTDVLIVVTYEDECFAPNCHYRIMLDGQDWYWWDGERVQGIPSKKGEWQDPPDIDQKRLMKGTMVDDAKFRRISVLAMEDLAFNG